MDNLLSVGDLVALNDHFYVEKIDGNNIAFIDYNYDSANTQYELFGATYGIYMGSKYISTPRVKNKRKILNIQKLYYEFMFGDVIVYFKDYQVERLKILTHKQGE